MRQKQYVIKIIFLVLLPAVLMTVMTSCGGGRGRKNISISGAFALYPMAQKWAEEYNRIYPDVIIDISAGGAGKGMTDALSDMVDLGMISREISKEELAKGAFGIPVVTDAVVPTMNSGNPGSKMILQTGMTNRQFREIFITGNITNWKQLNPSLPDAAIQAYTRSDACGAAETWAKYLGQKQENLKGIGVSDDPGMTTAVSMEEHGLGYNNINYAYDHSSRKPHQGIMIIPLDINENGKIDPDENFYGTLDQLTRAIGEGKYPSPPARKLYFVTKGKPVNPEILKFLKWILTDGQKYAAEAGYVGLPEETAKEILKKL